MVMSIYLTVIFVKTTELSLNDSLKGQLSQIYGQGKSKLKVQIPYVKQQNNSHDCGLSPWLLPI